MWNRMRNPILVFLSSIDHQFPLSKIYTKLRIYRLMDPHPFEYYCIFCREICDEWWKDNNSSEPYFMDQLGMGNQ